MPDLSLAFEHDAYRLAMPEEWLGRIAHPQDSPPHPDPQGLIRAALDRPAGCPPLRQLARRGMRSALIVDDYTRQTPASLVLPPLLEELRAAGLPPKDIRIVIAPGSHRRMSPAEIAEKLGPAVQAGIEVVQASTEDPEQMVYLGEGQKGIPLWANRWVAEADLRVGVGMITPHLDAGFSGGAKIILPGVCGTATIDAFHTASAFISGNQLGNLTAPLRSSLETVVAETIPLHFLFNLVLTLRGEIFGCTAGHAVQAHRQGVELARRVYGFPFEKRYPIVVAICAPYDQDLWQSIKGIWCGDLLVEDGGALIAWSAMPEGSRAHPSLPACIGKDPQTLIAELRAGTACQPMVAATAVMVAELRRRIRLALVSPGLSYPELEATRLPFYPAIEAALADYVGSLPPARRTGSVAVVPYAGATLPIRPRFSAS
jgi:nickel-dependent lactate racemase